MRIDTDNVSYKALYFPPIPRYGAIDKFQTTNAIRHNKYITQISKSEDIFVRFLPKEDGMSSHTLILDVVDLKNKITVKSLCFTSRLYASEKTRNINSIEFINRIEKPLKPSKTFLGAFLRLIFHPNQAYFNFNEVTPFTRESGLQPDLNNTLKEAELTRYKYNTEFAENIVRNNNNTAKIIEMY